MTLKKLPHVFDELNLDQPNATDFMKNYLHLFIPIRPLDNSQKYDRRLQIVLPSLHEISVSKSERDKQVHTNECKSIILSHLEDLPSLHRFKSTSFYTQRGISILLLIKD